MGRLLTYISFVAFLRSSVFVSVSLLSLFIWYLALLTLVSLLDPFDRNLVTLATSGLVGDEGTFGE